MKKNLKKSASALLISFFLMSILILVGLGVSSIVFRDLASVRTILNGKMSAYAAEGMSELGLGILKAHLPGYETDLEETLTNGATGTLAITARGEAVPCKINEDDEDYRTLTLNESIQLPLFADTETGVQQINDFSVEYLMPDNPSPQGNVLRWKILGINSSGNTEAISDYIAGDAASQTFDSETSAKFYGVDGGHYTFFDQYAISTFLADHTYNYLILTNAVQISGPESLASSQDSTDADLNSINFKMTAIDAVCEYIVLNATSDYGDTEKGVQTKVKEGENLPVFDFALYNAIQQ